MRKGVRAGKVSTQKKQKQERKKQSQSKKFAKSIVATGREVGEL